MIYLDPGARERLLTTPEHDLATLGETMDILTVSMEREPDWAIEAIHRAAGIRVMPGVMRVVNRQGLPVTALEVATLSAALRANSELRRGHPRATARSASTPSVEVSIALSQPDDLVASRERSPAKIGRNSPCPCGSGRKYKRCCLRKNEASERERNTRSAAADPALEERLAREILAFATDHHPGWQDALGPAWQELRELPGGLQLYVPLLAFQHHFGHERSARERFAERVASQRSPAVRALLSAHGEAVLSVWEVLHVEPGRGVEVIDLLTGDRRDVHEVSGSRTLRFRNAVLARVITLDGRSIFGGLHPEPLPPAAALEVVTAVRKLVGRRVEPVPPERLAAPPIVDALLTQWHAASARVTESAVVEREVQNTDGEPFAVHEDRFAIEGKDWRAVVDAIIELPGVYLDGRSRSRAEATFTKRGNAMHTHWSCTVIGSVSIDRKGLRVEANSRARIDGLREVLEGALGSRIVHQERKPSLPQRIQTATKGPIALDATRTGSLMGEPGEWFLREHARHLIETPNDALGGQTPREAMASTRGRRRLHQHLKEQEHLAPPGATTNYTTAVRELLGLSIVGDVIPRTAQERRLGCGRKISETLIDFALPLLQDLDDPSALRPALKLAVLVWNAGVLEEELDALSERALLRAIGEISIGSYTLEEFRLRRRRFFAEDQRLIRLMDAGSRGGEIYVQAAALMAPDEAAKAKAKTKTKAKPKAKAKTKAKAKPEQLDLLD